MAKRWLGPLRQGPVADATEVAPLLLVHNLQLEAMGQCASLSSAPGEFIGLFMILNVPLGGFGQVPELICRRRAAYTAIPWG